MSDRPSRRRALPALALALLATLPPATAQAAPAPSPRAAAPTRSAPLATEIARLQAEAAPFFAESLPAPLRLPGPLGLLWWQWLALPVLILLALTAGSLLGWVTRRILGHLAARTRTEWDDELLERVGGPLTALWAIALVTALHPFLLLDPAAEHLLQRALRAAAYLVLFWAGFRSVNVAFAAFTAAPWRTNASLAGLLPLGRKVAKIVLLSIGAVAVLNELGFQVASLIAGLGIGGIALALAAQKTVENLFGSLAIGVDQPFRVGDFVKVDDFVGTVETIGMRSTRFRTLDRTLITIPNGKLADMKSETFAPRDRIRLLVNLGLSYGTTAGQMREVLASIDEVLRTHPMIWTDPPTVRFSDLRDSTLNVEVMAWFRTIDWGEFTLLRQELLLKFMEIVERAGTSFAFPTRTVHLAPAPQAPPKAAPGPLER
jgi:MscS family membrane protein